MDCKKKMCNNSWLFLHGLHFFVKHDDYELCPIRMELTKQSISLFFVVASFQRINGFRGAKAMRQTIHIEMHWTPSKMPELFKITVIYRCNHNTSIRSNSLRLCRVFSPFLLRFNHLKNLIYLTSLLRVCE